MKSSSPQYGYGWLDPLRGPPAVNLDIDQTGSSARRPSRALLRSCRLLCTVVFSVCLLLALLSVNQEATSQSIYGPVKYSITAHASSESLSGRGPWSAGPFRRDHQIDLVKEVPVHKSRVVHVRHACVEGGNDGIVLPHRRSFDALGVLRDYGSESHKAAAFRIMTRQDEAAIFGEGGNNASFAGVVRVRGPAFFINCWRRRPDDTNPSHWLMKINKMYEIAEVVRSTHPPPLPRFDHLVFHQCPSYDATIKSVAWPWGSLVMDAATRHWTDAQLWKGIDDIDIVELNIGDRNWTCFDDLYFEAGYSSYFPAPAYQSSWLRTLDETISTSAIVNLSLHRHPSQPGPADATSLGERCRTNRLRIHLFQRSTGSSLRLFTNLDQVRALLQQFTSSPVPLVTVNESTPLGAQIDAFRAFDLLVTSHGSQMSNYIFCDPNTSAIVEVSSVVRDDSWYKNAVDANFTSYVLSTGHTPWSIPGKRKPICDDGRRNMDEHCFYDDQVNVWKCPYEWNSPLIHCNTFVNITILEHHVKKAVSDLCGRHGVELSW